MEKFMTWEEFEKQLNIPPDQQAEIDAEVERLQAEIDVEIEGKKKKNLKTVPIQKTRCKKQKINKKGYKV